MSVYVTVEVWEHSKAQDPLTLLVLLALADSADKESGETDLSVPQIAQMARAGTSTVRGRLRRLEEEKEIVKVSEGGGRGVIPRWRVNLGRYANPPDTRQKPASQSSGFGKRTSSYTTRPQGKRKAPGSGGYPNGPELTGARLDLVTPTPAAVLEAATSDAPTEVDPAFKRFVDKPTNRV